MEVKNACICLLVGFTEMEVKDGVLSSIVNLLAFSETAPFLIFPFVVSPLEPVVCALSSIYNGYHTGVHSNTVSEGW